MELFEKVEKLVQKTGCSYEEARIALEQCSGDLLDAMILLERQGKARAQGGSYSTRYEQQPQYIPVEYREETRRGSGSAVQRGGGVLSKLWHLLSTNFLVIRKNGEVFGKLPLWGALLILFLSWFTVVVLLIVSLFFGFTYSFEGEKQDKMQEANKVMDKFSRVAEMAKDEFKKP